MLQALAARQTRAIRAIGRFWIDSPLDLPEDVMQGEEEYRSGLYWDY